jgi:hypothetical protein
MIRQLYYFINFLFLVAIETGTQVSNLVVSGVLHSSLVA